MKAITDITIKDGGGEQFQDMDLGGIHEWIDTTPEKLTEDSLIEMSSSKSVPNDEEEDGKETVPETNWQYKCGRRFLIIQDYFLPTLWHGPFYDTCTEMKGNGGRRIGVIYKPHRKMKQNVTQKLHGIGVKKSWC